MKQWIRVVSLMACVSSVAALASTWEIDPAHTTATFSVKHMMVATVRGEFTKVGGTVELNDKSPTKSMVNLTIDASSVDTRVPARDAHLKSADFFDVANNPNITFKSTKIAPAGKDHWKVTGDLTIRGTTKPVTLTVNAPSTQFMGMDNKAHRGVEATGSIDRTAYGLNWNKTLEKGGVLVGNNVDITVDAELVKSDAPAADAAKPAMAPAPAAAANDKK